HQEKYMLMRELMEPMMADMFVTPKDIDETIARISFTISEAINGLCHHI
ncbi:MAG: GPR endopeptidase, partial [Clostridiales bacterium]|nr:GPR endopeptidase [Clostridiales bacterium]